MRAKCGLKPILDLHLDVAIEHARRAGSALPSTVSRYCNSEGSSNTMKFSGRRYRRHGFGELSSRSAECQAQLLEQDTRGVALILDNSP